MAVRDLSTRSATATSLQLRVAAVVLLVAVLVAGWHLHNKRDLWGADGAIYLRMAMQDRGIPADAARIAANRFMLERLDRSGSGANPYDSNRSLYTERPPKYYADLVAMFANRPLYPLLASLLYPAFGPAALKIVSAAAYVLTVGVMFALMCSMTSLVRATLGALVFATEQIVLNLVSAPLTDELALLFWTCTFGAIIAYQRRPGALALVILCLASIALTLTRPAFFLPLGAAAGAYLAMRGKHRTAISAAPFAAALPAALVYFVYTACAGGPNVLSQLRWQYTFEQAIHGIGADQGPAVWYVSALLVAAYQAVVFTVPSLGGVILVLLALFGARSYRKGYVRIALFSIATISIALLVNPLQVERTVLLPMAPLIVLLAIAGLERLRVSARTPAAAARYRDYSAASPMSV
jgi:hypothetical protein